MLNNLRTRYGKEILVDPGLENWTDDTPDDWPESAESVGVRDILKETTEIHGGSAAVKLQATDNDNTNFYLFQYLTLDLNKYYILAGWYYFVSRTSGQVIIGAYSFGGETYYAVITSSLTAQYTYCEKVFKVTNQNGEIHLKSGGESTGLIYFDDISIKELLPRHLGRN